MDPLQVGGGDAPDDDDHPGPDVAAINDAVIAAGQAQEAQDQEDWDLAQEMVDEDPPEAQAQAEPEGEVEIPDHVPWLAVPESHQYQGVAENAYTAAEIHPEAAVGYFSVPSLNEAGTRRMVSYPLVWNQLAARYPRFMYGVAHEPMPQPFGRMFHSIIGGELFNDLPDIERFETFKRMGFLTWNWDTDYLILGQRFPPPLPEGEILYNTDWHLWIDFRHTGIASYAPPMTQQLLRKIAQPHVFS